MPLQFPPAPLGYWRVPAIPPAPTLAPWIPDSIGSLQRSTTQLDCLRASYACAWRLASEACSICQLPHHSIHAATSLEDAHMPLHTACQQRTSTVYTHTYMVKPAALQAALLNILMPKYMHSVAFLVAEGRSKSGILKMRLNQCQQSMQPTQ